MMPKLVDHDARRFAIAAAAIDAIAEVGLGRVKLTDIGSAAGVTTGALAHYFPGRDALLRTAFDHVAERLFNSLTSSTETLRFGHFAGMLPVSTNSAHGWRVWLAFCGRVPHDPALLQVYDRYYETVETAVAGRLGVSDPTAARADAGALIAGLDGVGLCATMQPTRWPPDRQVAALHVLLDPTFARIASRQDLTDMSATPKRSWTCP